jgi:hypothetical protein
LPQAQKNLLSALLIIVPLLKGLLEHTDTKTPRVVKSGAGSLSEILTATEEQEDVSFLGFI